QARALDLPSNHLMSLLILESSAFSSAVWQNSNEAFIAATSLSLPSVPFNSSTLGCGTSPTFAQKELFPSTMWAARCPNVIWSDVGLFSYLSAGISSKAATVFFSRPPSISRRTSETGDLDWAAAAETRD